MASSSTASDAVGPMEDKPSTSREEGEEKEVDEQTQFELLHAIERFLEGGKFGRAAAALRRDINERKLVPSRTDYEGASHEQNYRQFLSALSHLPSTSRLTADTLPAMISRLSTLSDRAVAPPVKGLKLRLITNRRSALQRTNQVLLPPRLPNLLQDRRGHVAALKTKHSPIEFLRARELGSRVPPSLLPGERCIELIERHFRILGHLANVFCVAFDRTENYLITGADDNLVKVWNVDRALLKFTYRGHSGEIADLAVSHCNQLVASGSNDKTVRLWRLQNGETMAVFKQHTAQVTSVRFLPFTGNGSMRYLVTTGNDCIVNFYVFNEETLELPEVAPGRGALVYHRCERDQPGAKMVSICHSQGGHVVIIGESHGVIRVYRMHESGVVEKMQDLVAHTDRVDSLMWAHNGMRFCSGSKDGTAKIWRFQYGEWQQTVLALSQTELILICGVNATQNNPNSKNRYRVSMVCWTLDDSRIVTTGSEHSFRVWDATTGAQLQKLSLHTDDAFHLIPHPIHAHLVLSSGHDGLVAIWDVVRGVVVHKWSNTVENHEQAAVFDFRLTRDATRFAIVDNKGHVSLYGLGSYRTMNKKYKTPREQFFTTDYWPIALDEAGWAVDEQTGIAPHLMPPPRLISVDLEEHGPEIQAQVPGRDLGEDVDEASLVCPWLSRVIVPKLDENEMRAWAERMGILSEREEAEYTRELSRERPSSTQAVDAIVPLTKNTRASRPTSFRAAMATENAVAQARRTENNRLRVSAAQRMAILRRDVSLRYLGVEPDNRDDQDEDQRPLDAADMEVEEEEEETDTSDTDYESDGERRGREREREREREMQSSWQGTASRPRRREREVEEVEMDETSQQSRSERRGRRRRGEEDDFGNDLSIDMYDLPSTSTGRRGRGRREATEEYSERPERPERANGRRKRAPRSAEPVEDDEDLEMEMGGLEDTVVREERSTVRRQPSARDAWKYSFPPWMQAVKRKRFPYVAQLGDHVVYFRQGHEVYLNAVESTKLYPIEPKMIPKPEIGMEEFAVVDDIRYTLRPYRLTQLKLARTDAEGTRTGTTWTVKHHDLENVADFIILRAFYEEGLAMGLDVGDEMAAPIDDLWWVGTVENMSRNETYPNAHWQSVGVRWDNGEDDALSPWDVRKETTGRRSGQPVSEEEVTQMGTAPAVEGDWPEGDESGEATRRRLLRALETIRECDGAQDFRSPVDIEAYWNYPSKVPYPMDLTTICERIENQYYRRLRSLLQDVRHVALSAETYNQKGSPIVRNAKVLVEAIVRLANDPSIEDVVPFFDSCFDLPENELLEYKRKQRPEVNSEVLEMLEQTSRANGGVGSAPSRPGWIREAAEILEELIRQPCARHFLDKDEDNEELAPVWDDPACYDLRTLCKKVEDCEMGTPKDIEAKVQLLLSTAKNCIENRRSEIYKDLVALQSQFNARFKSIISKFENAQASVQSQLGVSLDRSLRRRAREREVPQQHTYNTRRSDHNALTAVALAAAAADYDEQPSSSRSAARHERGFYRNMANGAGGGRHASEETEVSSSSSRRTPGRRSTRNTTMRVEEEPESQGSRRSTRARRVIVDTTEEEEEEEEEDENEEAAKGLAPPSDEEVEVEVNGEEQEDEEEEEEEDEDGESSDYEEENYSSRRSKTKKNEKGRKVSKRKAVSTEEEEEDDESGRASTSTASSTRRSGRARKRPRIFSGGEEEEREKEKKQERRSTRSAARQTQRTYDERSDDDDYEEMRVATPSVSQRGRQRKVRSRD